MKRFLKVLALLALIPVAALATAAILRLDEGSEPDEAARARDAGL